MSMATEEESPFRKWLIDRGANQLFDYPIVDVESLFVTFDFTTQDPISPSVPWIETIAMTSYRSTHDCLKRAIRHGVHLWQIDLAKQAGRDEAIQLLFYLERVWDPVFYISDGTEEMEGAIFESERYWPELRIALGYPEWDKERLEIWKKSWEDRRIRFCPGRACNACVWRMTKVHETTPSAGS